MSACNKTASVYSETLGYTEICGSNVGFSRDCCTFTPKKIKWAGDLILASQSVLHQSSMQYSHGSQCDLSHVFEQYGQCPPETYSSGKSVQEVDSALQNDVVHTLDTGWDIGIAATNDAYCGEGAHPADGGDVLFNFETHTQVKSLCGTVAVNSFGEPKAFYLDNRRSYSEDPDNGLLVAIQNGLTGDWKVLYADALTPLNEGLVDAEDISAAFLDALTEKGISKQDVFSLGMI